MIKAPASDPFSVDSEEEGHSAGEQESVGEVADDSRTSSSASLREPPEPIPLPLPKTTSRVVLVPKAKASGCLPRLPKHGRESDQVCEIRQLF